MTSHKPIRQQMDDLFFQDPSFKTNILSEIKGNRFYITFNRPKRYNAFSNDMYKSFRQLVEYANENAEVKFIIVSGSGGNYSSGNDLSNFTKTEITQLGSIEDISASSAQGLEEFCAAIINSKKPIFGIVQGKVIGFAFTQLALFDRVFAVDGAQFNAPLVTLAQGPEMCASFTFPKIFGQHLGEDIICKNMKVDTTFLEKHSFLQKYASRKAAEEALDAHTASLEELEWLSYLATRKLFRDTERQQLLTVNHNECVNLIERWSHPNLPNHMAQYMMNIKSKSKL